MRFFNAHYLGCTNAITLGVRNPVLLLVNIMVIKTRFIFFIVNQKNSLQMRIINNLKLIKIH